MAKPAGARRAVRPKRARETKRTGSAGPSLNRARRAGLAGLAGHARALWTRVREDYLPFAEPVVTPIVRSTRTFTAAGRAVLVLALVSWIVAAWFGWGELGLVALGGLLLLVLASLFMLGHTNVEVTITVEPVRVTVGEPVAGEVTVINRGRTPLLPVAIEVPVGQGGVRFGVPSLGVGKRHDELFVVPTEKRGVIPVGPVTTVRGDAIGLFRRDVRWSQVTEIFVHPKITSLEPLGSGLIHDLEGRTSEAASPSDLAFHALREYVPGDDLRHVHWKSTAKLGKLLVRQFLDTRRAHLCVLFDAQTASYRNEDDFELGVSVAGSLLTRGILDGYDTSMVSGDLTMSGGNSRAALDICARVQPTQRLLLEVAGTAARIADDTSLLVMITGPDTDYIALQRAASMFGHEVTKLALHVDGASRPGLRTSGDFPMVTLSQLRELPGLMKWSA